MASFDVSFLNPKLRKSKEQDYGFLVDQLSIQEDTLSSDGKLAPGDYDLLIGQAQKLRSFPGLTNEQRSNIDVKISQYSSDKKKNIVKDKNDIARLKRDVENDNRQINMLFGNDPSTFLSAREQLLKVKLARLSDSINQAETAGDDTSAHLGEYNETLGEYQDIVSAMGAVQGYKEGKPQSGYVAYLTTNDRGEVINMDVGRLGSKSGYAQTNGVFGGLQVYGKINKNEDGRNVFLLGNKRFSAADIPIPDPENPLSFKSAPLFSESQIESQGGVTRGQKGSYDVIDPVSVRTQAAIPDGSYAEGSNGFLYQNVGNGQYKKIVGTTAKDLNIPETQIIKIPRNIEDSIIPRVTQTVGGMSPFTPSVSAGANIGGGAAVAPSQPGQQALQGQSSTLDKGRGRTGQPTQSSPATQENIFQKTLSGAKGLLSYVFNQGE